MNKTFYYSKSQYSIHTRQIAQIHILLNELTQHKFEFRVICSQETRLSHNLNLSLLQIPEYTLLSQGSIYVPWASYVFKWNLQTQNIALYKKEHNIGRYFIEIDNFNEQNILGNVYRPPWERNEKYKYQLSMN